MVGNVEVISLRSDTLALVRLWWSWCISGLNEYFFVDTTPISDGLSLVWLWWPISGVDLPGHKIRMADDLKLN